MKYYCTCNPKAGNKKNSLGNGFRETKADEQGVCLDCGYYAIASRIPVEDPRLLYSLKENRHIKSLRRKSK